MQIKQEHQQAPTHDGWYVTAWNMGENGESGEWSFGIFVQVEDGEFYDEDGELLESIFDPVLQIHVAADAADAYVPQ